LTLCLSFSWIWKEAIPQQPQLRTPQPTKPTMRFTKPSQ
jgi:hypothetical protein